MRHFVEWVVGEPPKRPDRLEIVQQQLPGDPERSEKEAEERGLPDACLHDGESWCLVIENKVGAKLTGSQLERHRSTLKRRGFENIHLLAITTREPKLTAIAQIPHLRVKLWTDVYRWARRFTPGSKWAGQLVRYLEAAEARMSAEGCLKEGTLTEFAGLPFNRDSPYNYRDAKRVLNVAMGALCKRSDLKREFHVDPEAERRAAITGREGESVWDFLRLREGRNERFDRFPHLTLEVGREQVLAIVVLPNSMKGEFRKRLVNLGRKKFGELVEEVLRRMEATLANAKGCVPWMDVVQRHYLGRKSPPIMDAHLTLDLRTALPRGDRDAKVRPQPEWLDAAFALLANRRSNIVFAAGAMFPYDRCESVGKPEALDDFAATWIACKPILDLVLRG